VREVRSSNTRCTVGIARRDITAPVGIYSRYWGAADHDAADGVHRPATATAISLGSIDQSDQTNLVLVAIDYGSFHPLTDEKEIRYAVQQSAGLDEASLLINVSHCHAGANASSQRTDFPGGEYILDYLAFLKEQIIQVVNEAQSSMTPAWITWGYGRCSLAVHRDYWDAEAEEFGCGFNPLGNPDDTLLVGRVTGDDDALKAVLFNYACHPTTLAWDNHLLSPDYVGAAREVIEQAFDAPALFFQGAPGDLGPRNGYVGDPAIADQNGRQLGYAVASTLGSIPPPATRHVFTGIVKSGADIATWEHQPIPENELASAHKLSASVQTIELPCKYIPSAAELREQMETAPDRPTAERLKRRLMVREDMGDGDTYAMPLWTWRLGDVALVAIPNEPYSVLQTSLRAQFADHPVMIMGVTNGTLGYLCPAEDYGTGRYQEKQSPFLPGCLELTMAGAARGVAQLFEPAVSEV
jgi:hypothetical protein